MRKIKVQDIVDILDCEIIVEADMNKQVKGAYTGDLLSNVMAKAKKGEVWITIQGHQNVIAVALLVEMSAVIVVEDFDLEEEALKRAGEKGINILRTTLSAFEVAGLLYQKGIRP